MTYNEQTDALTMEIGTLITRYTKEFDLNIQTIVGILEEKKWDLLEGGTTFFELDDDFFDDDDDLLDG